MDVALQRLASDLFLVAAFVVGGSRSVARDRVAATLVVEALAAAGAALAASAAGAVPAAAAGLADAVLVSAGVL